MSDDIIMVVMDTINMPIGSKKSLHQHQQGQSMVEFALILPLFVLFIVGIFELGRAFFAFIAITNAAREGARVITFWPGKTTGEDVFIAINNEIGDSPMVTLENIASRTIECATGEVDYVQTYELASAGSYPNPLECDPDRPVRVTITYNFEFILKILLPDPLTLRRSVEMMVP